jgi:hypothetical protein
MQRIIVLRVELSSSSSREFPFLYTLSKQGSIVSVDVQISADDPLRRKSPIDQLGCPIVGQLWFRRTRTEESFLVDCQGSR